MEKMSNHSYAKWDNFSDTWAATDGLGRSLPMFDDVGGRRKDKWVGMFYFLWHGEHGRQGPFNIEHILQQYPEAINDAEHPAWGPLGAYHHWGEPIFGYYLSDDEYVIAKHAQMLADAGVDVLIFDVTNQYTYTKSYMTLLDVFTRIRQNGGRTPDVAFLTPFGSPSRVVDQLFRNLYGAGLYADLWFDWRGKPLMLADPDRVDPKYRDWFTFRKPEPSYFSGPSGPNQWGWLDVYPQHAYYDAKGRLEQMTVGVAQNAVNGRLGSLSERGAQGRSFHQGKQPDPPYPTNEGLNFQEQWQRALDLDPEFVFVTGWNEWIAMRLDEFNGVRDPVMFVDQFNTEFSRDIEPMVGGHSDHYYYQLVRYIRRFKGVRKPEPISPAKTVVIEDRFQQWNDVLPEYRDDVGDTVHRHHPAWKKGDVYTNTSGRNDFTKLKVARDGTHLYFYASTRESITPHTDRNWMLLFIKIGNRPDMPNWEGYHFMVNRIVIDEQTTTLEQCQGGWLWETKCHLSYRVEGNEMHLAVPRTALSLGNTAEPLHIEFKWADNIEANGDVTQFMVNGDSAPNGRFTYVYREQ